MDDLGLLGVLVFGTFILVGTVTFLIVARVQHLRDGLEMVEKDYT